MENRWQEIWNKRKLNENNIKIGGGRNAGDVFWN